ncbi:MAG: twin-arginine translocase subunit TatC [Bacteroidota bacterium]|nr:twin-arginine translocase subunit TatC [Bacteroidota bacterium]
MAEEHKVGTGGGPEQSDNEMSFVEHLDKLRGHLIRGIIAIVLFAVVAFFFKGIIFDQVVLSPKTPDFFTNRILCKAGHLMSSEVLCINEQDLKIININIAGQFKAHIVISLIFGLMIAFPYVVFEIWQFLKPALKESETVKSRSLIFWLSFLFTLGVLFGYFIIVPLAINFLTGYSISEEVKNTINFSSYFSTVATTSLGAGIIFELPFASFVLAKIGLLTPEAMKKHRKVAIIIAFILSGILTPPDIFSQILVALPLIGLYQVSIGIVRRTVKKRYVEL